MERAVLDEDDDLPMILLLLGEGNCPTRAGEARRVKLEPNETETATSADENCTPKVVFISFVFGNAAAQLVRVKQKLYRLPLREEWPCGVPRFFRSQ